MKIFILGVLVMMTLQPAHAFAQKWNIDTGGVLSSGSNAVIEGYDPVAYFTEGKAVKGNPDIFYVLDGAKFLFSNEKNKSIFASDPERYSPQYGGFCAYAVAKGDLVEIDPQAWKISNGKLYLNYSKSVQEDWEEDISMYITQADENWPKLTKE